MIGQDGGLGDILRQGKPLPKELMVAMNGHSQPMMQVPPVLLVQGLTWYDVVMTNGETHHLPVMGTVNRGQMTLLPSADGRGMIEGMVLEPIVLVVTNDPSSVEPCEDTLIMWHAIAEMKIKRPFNEAEMAATKKRQEKSAKAGQS